MNRSRREELERRFSEIQTYMIVLNKRTKKDWLGRSRDVWCWQIAAPAHPALAEFEVNGDGCWNPPIAKPESIRSNGVVSEYYLYNNGQDKTREEACCSGRNLLDQIIAAYEEVLRLESESSENQTSEPEPKLEPLEVWEEC